MCELEYCYVKTIRFAVTILYLHVKCVQLDEENKNVTNMIIFNHFWTSNCKNCKKRYTFEIRLHFLVGL